jgi:RNA polymerase sigma-70 factor (ECF subfamily)
LLAEHRHTGLAAAIAGLPHEQKETLVLKLEAGLDLQAIADITGVSRETAKSRLRYAVGRLKLILGEH